MKNTYNWYIDQIQKYNSEADKVQRFKKLVEEHISGLRLTAMKMRGTAVAKFCNKEANELEKKLSEATKNVKL